MASSPASGAPLAVPHAAVLRTLKRAGASPDERAGIPVGWVVLPNGRTVTWEEALDWVGQLAAAQLAMAHLKQKPWWLSTTAYALIGAFGMVAWIVLDVIGNNADLLPEPYQKLVPLILVPLVPQLAKWWGQMRAEQEARLADERKVMALTLGGPQMETPAVSTPTPVSP